MAKLTRSGVAYDLTISPHKTEILYDGEIVTFIFSSELYRNKFEEKIEDHRNKLKESLSKRFDMDINVDVLSDIRLYNTTEKRGFLIKYKEESYRCLSTIKLDGLKLTSKN